MAEWGREAFVSYGHEDAEWALVLATNLEQAGLEVLRDEWEPIGPDRYAGQLEEGVRRSACGVIVMSPHSLSQPWAGEEYESLRRAVEQPGQRLIPVLYADASPPVFIANRLWVDFRRLGTTGPEYEAKLDELVRALRGRSISDRFARTVRCNSRTLLAS
jgi:hypothetical protein